MNFNCENKEMTGRSLPHDRNSDKHHASSNSLRSSRNALSLLVRREICPKTKHVPKRRWGETSRWNANSSPMPKSEPARDAKRGLISWVEAESLRHLSAKYCPLVPPPRSTIAAAFSPDGRTLASTHGDHTVKIIDCQTGNCLKVLTGHRRTPWVVRFHPLQPEILASGSLDYEVRLWDANTSECIGSRDFYRPIASIAFHAEGELLAVASGHKLYIWHYNRRGEASSPTIVLKTRRSLRAVHFHPHAAPFLLTAEVNDLDSSDSSMTRATSPGYLRYPPPAVFMANAQSSERVSLAAELPLMSFPFLFMPSFSMVDTRTDVNRHVGSSIMQVESSSSRQLQSDANAAENYDTLVSPMETFPVVPSSREGTVSNPFPSGMRSGLADSMLDAMETDEMQPLGGNHTDPETSASGNNMVHGESGNISVRQQSTEAGQLHQHLSSREPTWWELRFLQGWLMGQSQAGVPSVLPLNSGGREYSSQFTGSSSTSYPSNHNMETAVATLAMPTSLSGVSGRSLQHNVPPIRFSGESAAPMNMQHDVTDNQPIFNRIQSEIATSLAAAAAELPCTVKLRVWSHDIQNPCAPLNAQRCRLTIPHAVLCSEMGAHFSPCGRYLAACVACMLPNMETDFCSKLGPFVSDKEIKATDGSFKGVELFMQNVKCKQMPARGNVTSANVAAFFRAVPPMENQYVMGMRSGPSNMTVATEGIWKSSSGQLCMVGCLGQVDTDGSSCNSRVCLYIPVSFSIKQRSILIGSFSSTDKINPSYFPLAFEKLVRPTEMWNYFRNSRPYYSYSKIEKASIILERNEPFSFQTVIKKSLLQFPKLEDTEAYITSLSLLAEDLTLHTSAFPDPFSGSRTTRTDFQMEILSLGPLFGRYWSSHNISSLDEETPYLSKSEYTEKQLLMNVSAQITLNGDAYSNFSVLFLEGLYDLHVGKMYLVGCRDVRASWNILFDSMDLEGGLDCLIEVVVSYPPTTSRWLVNPTARISISSQRNGDDPLHFSAVKLQTLPIMYRRQREDILSRRGVEGILRILTLSFAIACILSQLFYIRQDADSVPFISLVMLGVQALGYSLPLITGAEALFKRMSSEPYETSSYDLEKNQWVHVIDYTVKLLVLVSFLLTLRLCQKVWKSRIRLLARTPNEPHRVPSDKRIFLATLTIHVLGYVIVLIINSLKASRKPFRMEKYVDATGNSRTLREWETELEEYVGLVQDFFLLPQVIGNIMWQIDCKPLKELYFIGITFVRLLPHVYDYIRAPVPNPYFADEYEFVNPNMDFYSKFGDIAIPTTAVLLAAAVYIQQRWNYEKLSQSITIGQWRLLPMNSRMYQRLPSKSFESELASGVNEDAVLETEREEE